MKFFVDTAKIEDIKKANDMGVICGVTTNPSLIAKEGGRSQRSQCYCLQIWICLKRKKRV